MNNSIKYLAIAIGVFVILILSGATLFSEKETTENSTSGLCAIEKKKVEFDKHTLINKTWTLIEVEGLEVTESDKNSTFSFKLSAEGQQVMGFDGCNKVSGDYSILDGQMLHFSNLSSTEMACESEQINGRKLIDVLYFAGSFKLEDKKLIFNSCEEVVFAVFQES